MISSLNYFFMKINPLTTATYIAIATVGSFGSPFTLIVSMNTAQPSCTQIIGPITTAGDGTCAAGAPITFALDDWGSVKLTADGAYLSLPRSVEIDPRTTGLLVAPPSESERNGTSCPWWAAVWLDLCCSC